MKRRISIYLLIVCLLLSTLVGCAPVAPPIDDTPAPTPDAAADPSPQPAEDEEIPEDEEILADDIIIEPITPITPIEPIEDIDITDLADWIDDYLRFYSMEDWYNFISISPNLSHNSEAYETLTYLNVQDAATYYLIDTEQIPDGYELIYILYDELGVMYTYSCTPEEYDEYPWHFPEETTLKYCVFPELFELNGKIEVNGEIADGSDIIIKYTVGNNDHVTE